MKKTRLIKNTWYDRLINHIPEPVRKSVAGFKDKIVRLFKTNTPKQTFVWEREETKQTKKTKY